ncbi:MAG: hypothetical protein A2086_08605 [Spirochaetes bacterium GWD1_27_9]|nr:MAG: hypothetical protein A2Z98_17745 [Spirochaetes bacterium GWB1_27_13]OHD44445.1 MAG: hypothetical protein A2086_08605 [Spirochaetes bacterium GWD1_27_9]
MRLNFLILIVFLLIGCKSLERGKPDPTWDFEKYMLESQRYTTSEKYFKAVDLLKEAIAKFPNEDLVAINYNIAFNYFKLRRFEEATSYFNSVIKLFEEKDFSEAQKMENKKFVLLSNIVLDRIKVILEELKDPYHIQEDIKKNKVIKPKK